MADISAAFVVQYQAEVHMAYQQGASKLRNTVRLKTGVVGASTKFTRVGKGEATQKTRKGNVVPMDIDHSQVEAVLADWYAPDYVDKLDEYKVNYDERRVVTMSGAAAIGRKVDGIILAAALAGLPAGQLVTDAGAAGLTVDHIMAATERLNSGDVPDNGQRFAFVGPKQWNALLLMPQFARSEYIGDSAPPWLKGAEARKWLGVIWQMHSHLPTVTETVSQASVTYRQCLLYHTTALGLAEGGSGVTSEINYVAEKVSYLCNNMISCGAVRIDDTGLVCLKVKE